MQGRGNSKYTHAQEHPHLVRHLAPLVPYAPVSGAELAAGQALRGAGAGRQRGQLRLRVLWATERRGRNTQDVRHVRWRTDVQAAEVDADHGAE